MVMPAHARDNPRTEIHRLLHTVKVACSRATPDREAVQDVRKGMTLDKELKDVGTKMMANFIQTYKDGIALFDNVGDVLFPG